MGQEKTSGRGEHPNRLVAAPPRTIARRRTADAAVGVHLFALAPSITSVFGIVCPAARVGETRKANRENKTPRETEGRDHGTYSQKESGTGGGARVDHGLYSYMMQQFVPFSLRVICQMPSTYLLVPTLAHRAPACLSPSRLIFVAHTHSPLYSNTTNFLYLDISPLPPHTRTQRPSVIASLVVWTIIQLRWWQ